MHLLQLLLTYWTYMCRVYTHCEHLHTSVLVTENLHTSGNMCVPMKSGMSQLLQTHSGATTLLWPQIGSNFECWSHLLKSPLLWGFLSHMQILLLDIIWQITGDTLRSMVRQTNMYGLSKRCWCMGPQHQVLKSVDADTTAAVLLRWTLESIQDLSCQGAYGGNSKRHCWTCCSAVSCQSVYLKRLCGICSDFPAFWTRCCTWSNWRDREDDDDTVVWPFMDEQEPTAAGQSYRQDHCCMAFTQQWLIVLKLVHPLQLAFLQLSKLVTSCLPQAVEALLATVMSTAVSQASPVPDQGQL